MRKIKRGNKEEVATKKNAKKKAGKKNAKVVSNTKV